ncbi:MAG: lysylphosphatidylglycerol synthase transmembrane domain-containing protein [Nanoarchaeota archaeon]|nr:lysylphosphatidylglycerol synthase transmembrane domain-containing protein [Nanoarchaeota archaeon]
MKAWLKLVVSALILVLFFTQVPLAAFWRLLVTANLPLLLVALLIMVLTLILDGVSLHVFLPKGKLHWKDTLVFYGYAWCAGLILPGRSGDLVILPFLKKKGIGMGEGLAAVLLNRMLSFALVLLVGGLGLVVYLGIAWWIALALALAGCAAMVAILLLKFPRELIKKYVLRKRAAHFQGFSIALSSYARDQPKTIALKVLLTSGKIVLGGLVPYLIYLALGTEISFFALLAIFNAATLLSLVPFTLSGLGLREGAVTLALERLGVEREAAFGGVLISTAMAYFLGVLLANALPAKTD